MKKYVGLVAVLILLLSLFAGCTGDTVGTETGDTGTEEASETGDTGTETAQATPKESVAEEDFNETSALNLHWDQTAGAETYIGCPWVNTGGLFSEMIYDTLIYLDADRNMLPGLAKEIRVSEDGMTYTFTLEEGVKWHDGEPFTAKDVAFSFNANYRMPDAFFGAQMKTVEGAQDVMDGNADAASGIIVQDDNTLMIKLSSPDFTVRKAWARCAILPEHLLKDVEAEKLSTYEPFFKMPVGTGAYMVDETAFPDYFTLVANENYWAGAPKIKHATFTNYTTGGADALAAALIAGELDIAEGNAVNNINMGENVVENNPEIEMVILPANYQRQFFFNGVGSADGNYNESVQDPNVRKAFNLIIDKDAVAAMYPGQGTTLTTWVNPDLSAYNSDIPLWKRDVTTGKKMLDDAGFDYSKPIRIAYYYDDQTTKDIMDILTANFAEVGVTVETFLLTGDLSTLLYDTRNFEMGYFGNCDIFPIADYSTLIPSAVYDKLLGFVEERQIYSDLIKQYTASNDEMVRKELGDQIQVQANDDMYIIPLYNINRIFLYNSQKVDISEKMFNLDYVFYTDWDIETWELLK